MGGKEGGKGRISAETGYVNGGIGKPRAAPISMGRSTNPRRSKHRRLVLRECNTTSRLTIRRGHHEPREIHRSGTRIPPVGADRRGAHEPSADCSRAFAEGAARGRTEIGRAHV